MVSAEEIVKKYISYFKKNGHLEIPSASLIPENDPTVLFTTAGMHPLVPFLLGQPHPLGKRLTNIQKCLRTDDIDEVGDNTHNTFFFMLGNWSLGDYFKEEAIKMSFEFLTKELGIDINKLSVSVFSGDDDAPRDEESAHIWEKMGIPKERIYYFPKKDNWWGPAGETGPCGPDTEMFYDTGKNKCSEECRPGCGCGKYVEIWNDVFMQYNKTKDGKYELLKQKNVDTGMGLERTVAVLQGKDNIFATELFERSMKKINELSKKDDEKSKRIIADHLRAATFILADDYKLEPSNVERGYVLRRLIRRAIRYGRVLGIEGNFCRKIAEEVVKTYSDQWPELKKNENFIYEQLEKEENRFSQTIDQGMKKFEEIFARDKKICGNDAFLLLQSYGFPPEMTEELARERGGTVDMDECKKAYEEHKELSRASQQCFKSGLADHSDKTVALHTATHLLHEALRRVLGTDVRQRGSNITPERLRFDFAYPQKLTPEQLKKVQDMVNEQIEKKLDIVREEKTMEEAKAEGALAFFADKYGTKVFVYSVGNFSKEVCSGPHVQNTCQLGKFKIIKEEAVSAGVRRIKAVLEKE